ncbi:hypothetical protein [Rhizobium sp. CCGE531]|uniref:hypothetical protein n=1 Tax=Rhizobium sp. CCGE531 TaxID=2364271 RepID=UPI0013C3FA62|nr:hypothetical protein [Rhizobium sp. CCGE531]
MKRFLIVFLLSALPGFARADACNTDCNNKCCRTIQITPFDRNSICDPACKASCEAAKGICRAGGHSLPSIPSLVNEVTKLLEQSCSSAFETITKAVVFSQPFYGAGSDYLINSSRDVLVQTRLFASQEFGGVTIRWCRLLQHTAGMTPDPNLICINDDLFKNNQPLETAITIAHEMTHIREYRRMATTDSFKCEYSKEYVRCGGRQDRCMPLEREAYDFEDGVACPTLTNLYYHGTVNAQAFCTNRASRR